MYFLKLVIVIIAIMCLLDESYSYIFQNGVPRSKIQKILQLNNKHYDIAFLGSSRTENHIDCELIEKLTGKSCVNLGISGGTIGDMLVLMTLTETKSVTFNEVFLQVDYSYNYSGMSNNFKASLVPYIKNESVKNQLKNNSENYYYRYVPFYRYMKYDKVVGFREISSIIFNKKPKIDHNIGFAPKSGNGSAISGKLPKAFKDRNLELEELVKLLEVKNIELSCFTAPFCIYMENRESMNLLKERVPNFKNYIYVFDDNPEYFFNCGHLNVEGARVFTEIIGEDLLKPINSNL